MSALNHLDAGAHPLRERRSTGLFSRLYDRLAHPDHREDTAPPRVFWTDDRRAAAERVWGEGFVVPGGAAFVTEMAAAAALLPGDRLLYLGAGLGGGPRALGRAFGVRVDALEGDPMLARAAADGNDAAVAVRLADWTRDPAAEGGYDCVLVHEMLAGVDDKDALIERVAAALAPDGVLVAGDIVKRRGGKSRDLTQWLDAEPNGCRLWQADDFAASLRAAGLVPRARIDDTDRYRLQVVRGWQEFVGAGRPDGLAEDLVTPLIAEVERWTRRVELLAAGTLGFVRIEATRR